MLFRQVIKECANKMKPELIVAIGGIITLAGAAISIYGGYRTGQQQTEDAKKLSDAQIELGKAQSEGFRQVTGGDSFCYLKVLIPPGTAKAELVVLHVGKYPLSDVLLRLVDSDQLNGPTPPGMSSLERLQRAQINIPISTIPVKGFWPAREIQIPNGIVEKRYLASFTARNGSWDESIILRQIPSSGAWRVALKVNENPGQVTFAGLNTPRKLLFQEVPPDFPVKSNDEIQAWLGS
jgi:hypothetical protein